jgi:hypothetical protein
MSEISGSDVDKIEMIKVVRGILIDLFRGYPAWRYYGIIEGRFKGNLGIIVRDKLKEDGFIDIEEKEGKVYYWLTSKGVQIASPLFLKQKVKDYGLIGAILIGMTIVIGLAHLFLSYFQNPIPLL